MRSPALSSEDSRSDIGATGDTSDEFRSIFDDSPVALAAVGVDGVVTAANRAFAMLARTPVQAIVGRPFVDLAHADDRATLDRRLQALRPTEPLAIRLRRDGAPMAVTLRVAVRSGAAGGAVIAAEPATGVGGIRGWKDDEALERSEARYRAIVEAAVDAILITDVRGMILTANPAAERLFGYSLAELEGKPVHILMPRDEAEVHQDHMDRYIATGEAKVIGVGREVTAQRRDGTRFDARLSLVEIRRPGFHVFVGMIRDVTEHKRAERALVEAKEAADLANRAKTAFLSNMSHELRTPLNGILGFAEVMRSRLLGMEDQASLTYVAEIQRAGGLLLANINDLLEMASIEAGQVELEETIVDFRDVVVACLRMVGRRAEQAKLALDADMDSELPPMMADPVALKQILLHLLSNAIKFTPAGGRVGVSARVDSEGALTAEVFDTGIGIPDKRMETLFLPFVQGDGCMTKRFEGIGLGLSIAKSLVEKHGGRLTLRSVEGTGTTVIMRFPIDRIITDW